MVRLDGFATINIEPDYVSALAMAELVTKSVEKNSRKMRVFLRCINALVLHKL